MPVLDSCSGLVVDILVHQAPLHEYNDEMQTNAPATAMKYAAVKIERELEVRYTFTQPPASYEGIVVGLSTGQS